MLNPKIKLWGIIIMDIETITGSFSGVITIDRQNNVVTKRFKPDVCARWGLYNRELFWLQKLSSFNRTPNLISYDEDSLYIKMEYMGEKITKDNIPDDWKKQCKFIINKLQKYKCSHNDIKPTEILVLDGKINIIDFGWSTALGKKIPSDWPTEIGGGFKLSEHKFDDYRALTSSIKCFIKDEQ